MTLLSKKLPGIRLVTIELEIGRQNAAETPQPLQPLFAAWLSFNFKGSGFGNLNVDVVTFLQPKRFDDASFAFRSGTLLIDWAI